MAAWRKAKGGVRGLGGGAKGTKTTAESGDEGGSEASAMHGTPSAFRGLPGEPLLNDGVEERVCSRGGGSGLKTKKEQVDAKDIAAATISITPPPSAGIVRKEAPKKEALPRGRKQRVSGVVHMHQG